jgi:aspartyl-tRNA(Asn)/glutamyl-tRNA(Gln) amidotransferase subunit A
VSSSIDIANLTATQIAPGIAGGEFWRWRSQAALGRIEALDGDVHAFNQVTPDLALSAAEKIDALVASGAGEADLPPLAGGRPRSRTT